jgi:uncharacterized protein DUF5615
MNDDPAGYLFAKLLCDVMIPAEFSAAISARGFDVAEVRNLPPSVQQDDWAILTLAEQQQRAVVTCNYSDHNSNFCLIHEEWQVHGKVHSGIILVPQYQISDHLQRWDVRDRLLNFLNQHTADEIKNRLLWLPQE